MAAFLLLLAPALAGQATAGEPDRDDTTYYVLPGERGGASAETLPDVAEKTLGDRDRWAEILVLNQGRVQPDGSTLTSRDDPLQAGWSLVLPDGARSGEIRIGPLPSDADDGAATGVQSAGATTVGGGGLWVPGVLGLGPVVLVCGAVLLLALLAAVAVVVTRLVRRRAPVRAPRTGPAIGGDRERMVLDRALNQLPPVARPQVFAAVVGPDQVSLRLTPAVPDAPPPWRAREQGAVWEAPNWQLDAPAAAPGAHPFPLLAPLGTIGGAWTAVDLGRAPGLIAFTGQPRPAAAAVGLMLDAVGSDPRAATVAITVVGPVPSTGLPPGRLRVVGAVRDVPGLLAQQPAAPDVTGMLDNVWGPGGAGGQLNRHLVVVTAPIASAELELLGALAARSDNTAAVVLVGDHPNAAWRFGVGADGALDVGVLGLHLDSGTPERARLAGSGRP